MKRNFLKLRSWAVIALIGSFTFTSCSDDDDNGGGGDGNEDEIVMENGTTLSGEIASGKTVILSSGYRFKLSGGYAVKNGAKLKIEKGVILTAVKDDIADYILVEQGGYIDAQGTADDPIIMTAEDQTPGGWGGIHICGYAHTNKGAGTKSEIGNAPYGGNKENDNSGILRYIRLEYTGFSFDDEHESNGVSFYGVGNGTTVEYLQSYKGADDGFEFFGGSVNVKYLLATDNEDDSFDWTEGWNGKAQFLVATQLGTSGAKDMGDCLIEADNNGDDATATPVAFPTLSNLTLIGNNSTEGKRGIRLRAGTKVKIYNALVTGKPECLTTETEQTENALVSSASDASVLKYMTLSSDIKCNEGIYSSELFRTAENHNEINQNLSFENVYVGTVEGGADLSADSFFTKATYRGAVKKGADWTQGWTK